MPDSFLQPVFSNKHVSELFKRGDNGASIGSIKASHHITLAEKLIHA
jgi:hypothetical protein